MKWFEKWIRISLKQINGFFFVLVLLFGGFVLPELFYKNFYKEPEFTKSEMIAWEFLMKQLDSLESLTEVGESPQISPTNSQGKAAYQTIKPIFNKGGNQQKKTVPKVLFEPFLFDPNKPDSVEWLKLGLSSRQIRTVYNYVSKGGKFRFREDFRKIYGISEEQFEKLMPYVDLPLKNE